MERVGISVAVRGVVIGPWVVLVLALVASCFADGSVRSTSGGSGAARARPSASDLMTLVPSGAHVLVRLDLRRLRRFWRKRPWTKHIKADGVGSRLHAALGSDLLRHAEELVVALWLDGGAGVGRILMLARGPRTEGLGLASLARRALQGQGRGRGLGLARPPPRRPPGQKAPRWRNYRQVAITDGRGASTALLTPFTVASGPSTMVRQSVDLLRGIPGRSSAREDRVLMALWRLVAGEGAGRAPLVAGVVRLPAELRARVSKRLALPSPIHRVGLRLSGGRWLTARGFVDVAGRKRGRATVKALHRWVQRIVATRMGQRLHLAALLASLSVHHEGGRVHVQWVLPTRLLDRHGRALTPVLKLLGGSGRSPGKVPSPRERK
jgi:hypothetical protein